RLFRSDLRTFLATSLVLATTSCATIQSDTPAEVQLEEAQEEVQSSFDYIDDRLSDEPELDAPAYDDEYDPEFDDQYDEYGDEYDEYGRRYDDRIRQLSLFAGYRNFSDDGLWDRVDAETTLGLEYAQEIKNGIGFEVGGLGSLGTDDGVTGEVDVTGAAAELYGGGRYWFRTDSRWTPYVGAGLSAILAGVDNDIGGQVADDQDFSIGFYLHGGVQYDLNDYMILGLDLRTLQGTDLELETTTGDADYVQLGLILGFRL
ncbi:MAG: outer membrane beta-barrel protein, partial [Planctomycetota bacterium]